MAAHEDGTDRSGKEKPWEQDDTGTGATFTAKLSYGCSRRAGIVGEGASARAAAGEGCAGEGASSVAPPKADAKSSKLGHASAGESSKTSKERTTEVRGSRSVTEDIPFV